MKFISKNSNLRVILKPGIPSEPLTGRAADPAISLKFEDGIAIVNDEKIIAMAKSPEKGFGVDYICADNDAVDPYNRISSEPEHDLISIEHGGVGKNMNPKTPFAVSPEMRKMIANMVAEGVKDLAPKMAAAMVASMVSEAKASSKTTEVIEKTEEVEVSEGEKPEIITDELATKEAPVKNTKTTVKAKK